MLRNTPPALWSDELLCRDYRFDFERFDLGFCRSYNPTRFSTSSSVPTRDIFTFLFCVPEGAEILLFENSFKTVAIAPIVTPSDRNRSLVDLVIARALGPVNMGSLPGHCTKKKHSRGEPGSGTVQMQPQEQVLSVMMRSLPHMHSFLAMLASSHEKVISSTPWVF